MADDLFLVCPACEHTETADEPAACPACGSDRAYLHHAPALPDETTESFVKGDGPDDESA